MNKIFPRKAGGFTIMELIIVVVIIGVLAAIALPSYRIQMRKIQNQEAIRNLMFLWEAQKDYYRDNGGYTSVASQLAIDIPLLKNFRGPSINGWQTMSCTGPAVLYLAANQARDFSYSLAVLENGRIVCVGGGGSGCSASICKKMGFKDDW